MEEQLEHPAGVAGTKLIVGLFFTIVGVLLAADNLDLFDADVVLRYWPAAIVLIGLVQLADPGRRLIGTIVTVIGVLLLADNAGWIGASIGDLWPLLLIVAGLVIVARALGFRAGSDSTEGDVRNIVAILSQRKIANTSQEFAGARAVAFMGGCELDLTQADIASSPAVIEAFAMWGGVEIYVPDGWEIIGEVVPVMAGFEIKTVPTSAPRRQLIVRGAALMGGIVVTRRKS